MIRIAVDLFLLEPGQYADVCARWPDGAEFARARGMAMPGPERETPPDAVLIRDMIDPEEQERERIREMRLWDTESWQDATRRRLRAEMNAERYRRRAERRNAPDVSVFWLPNVTENSDRDREGRHWYPFSGPPPERQQWMVWQEFKSARIAWLSFPPNWVTPHHLPERIPDQAHIRPAATPADAIGEALAWTIQRYRTMPYEDYLSTPHWLRTRDAAASRAGHVCADCGNYSPRIEVHHLSYERRGEELQEDLRVLCRCCHEAAHGIGAEE